VKLWEVKVYRATVAPEVYDLAEALAAVAIKGINYLT
jgi:hypothetical protein